MWALKMRFRHEAILVFLLAAALLLTPAVVVAHGGEDDGHPGEGGAMLDEKIRQGTFQAVVAGGVLLVLFVGISAVMKQRGKLKGAMSGALFLAIAAVVIAVTAYVAGSTIYLNIVSETGGPVHWHADFEIWNCGSHVDLVDPSGFSNKVGSAVMHEHGDSRMHVEGVIVDYTDASVGKFIAAIGGELRSGWLRVPTTSGEVTMMDGDTCGNGKGKLQVFVWKTSNGRAVQERITGYSDYVISPHGQVPPGDCIILEFDSGQKESTERMCESYEAAIKRGALNGG